ncbi:MAG: hypothetical protein IJO93_00655 [Clostridia bacterium]|nr:hypothetical protein [Clostridia bacterium]
MKTIIKASIITMIFALMLTVFSGCVSTNEAPASANDNKQETEQRFDTLDGITVTAEPDPAVKRYIIKVENKTDKALNAYLHLYIKDGSRTVASDTMIIEELKPGNSTWCNLNTDDVNSSYKFEYSFTQVEWSEIKEEVKQLDSSKSKELTDWMYENFGGMGNPQFAASWYSDIQKIEAYKVEGGYSVVVTLKSSTNATVICNSIAANKKKDGVKTVEAVDSNGNSLYIKSN